MPVDPPNTHGTIYFPQDQDTAVCKLDSHKVPFFAPYGYFDSPSQLNEGKVCITYKDKDGHDQNIPVTAIATQPAPPNNWSVLFKDKELVPENSAGKERVFTLTVTNKKGDVLTSGFTLADPTGKFVSTGRLSILLIHINSPTVNQTVPSSFSCSGSTTESLKPLTGSLVDSNHVVYPGTTVYNQDEVWIVSFADILPGSYGLAVSAGSSFASVSPIFVVPNQGGQAGNS